MASILFLDTFSHEFQLSNKTTKQSALEKGIFEVLRQYADYTFSCVILQKETLLGRSSIFAGKRTTLT